MRFEVTEAARAALVHEGYDPTFGARPMRRTIERRLENELAKRMLGGDFEAGDAIEVDVDAEGNYTFSKVRAAEPVAV